MRKLLERRCLTTRSTGRWTQPPPCCRAPATAELDAAWEGEIERRLAAYDRGEIQSLSAKEVFAKARALAK